MASRWTASTRAGRGVYANDLLYWAAIRWAVQRGLNWLDLGRSAQIADLVEQQRTAGGAANHARPLWALVVFQYWLEHWVPERAGDNR